MAAGSGSGLAVADDVHAAARDAQAFEEALGGASASLTESEIVAVGATLVAVAFDANLVIGELVEALGVVLEPCFLVGLDARLVEVEKDDLELTVTTNRACDASEVVAALAGAAVTVERTLSVVYATAVLTAVTLGAATARIEITSGAAAIVFADLAVETVAVTVAPVRDGGAAIVPAFLTALAVGIGEAPTAHTIDTEVRASSVADAVFVVVAVWPAGTTRSQRDNNYG